MKTYSDLLDAEREARNARDLAMAEVEAANEDARKAKIRVANAKQALGDTSVAYIRAMEASDAFRRGGELGDE